MKGHKRNNPESNTQNLDSKLSANPLDQFSDVVYKTVDNMVDGDDEQLKPQE
ncbi:hypothetical protein [Bacillus marasmi]|uniref:hypothetical protein n=1 Tax=Bacillus marasmi TaxID=1926279 RepID=UPI00164DA69D|nr:hypothetical protein [Bacillus marasmi]